MITTPNWFAMGESLSKTTTVSDGNDTPLPAYNHSSLRISNVVGDVDGLPDGEEDGPLKGELVGGIDGLREGEADGFLLGDSVGFLCVLIEMCAKQGAAYSEE